MPPYRLARLTDEQMTVIEHLENDLGVTLVAYEPACDAVRTGAEANAGQMTEWTDDNGILDGLVDTYRTYDPHI